MKKFLSAINSRTSQFTIIPVLILVWFIWTDPSPGFADTLLRVQLWAQALLVTGVAYAICKAMLGTASSEDLYEQSIMGNYAAGIAYLGVCIMRVGVLIGLLLFFAQVQK
jgi:hypothetical protein